MARGGQARQGKRKHKNLDIQHLNKKQKKHLKEFGEIHPADEGESSTTKYKKVEDIPVLQDKATENEPDTDSEGEDGKNAYQDLLLSLGKNQDDDKTSSEEDQDSDLEGGETDLAQQASQVGSDGEVSDSGSEGALSDDLESEGRSDEDAEGEGHSDDSLEGEGHTDDEQRDESGEEEAEKEADEDLTLKESDPFTQHFEQDLEETFVEQLSNLKKWTKHEPKITSLGRCILSQLQQAGTTAVPHYSGEKDLRKLCVKKNLYDRALETNKKIAKVDLKPSEILTTTQQAMFSILNQYQDLYYPERTHQNGEEIRFVYCLHALNHVLKTRSRVLAHNAKIKAKGDDVTDDYRDQALARPKVLIVVPFRESALRIVNMMTGLLMPKDQVFVSNKKRFQNEFGSQEETKKGYKPADFEATFDGNTDDHFRIGLSIAKKTLKLYSEFYSSDIIVASPLGLRTVIGADGEAKQDYDFLSSIEMLIMDQTDVFLMQNWDHILHLTTHMHLQPKEAHGTDFSRIRMWTLNGWSKYYRQTLLFSSVATSEINALFNRHCHNYAGKLLVMKPPSKGTISHIVVQLPQVFHRVDVADYGQLPDARFDFFKSKILPQFKDSMMKQTLVYIPSYFDYVRIRNYLEKQADFRFVSACEYTKDKTLSRNRSLFFHGMTHMMLFTERFHFYRRNKIRGIKHLIFYELPTFPHFYSEMCNMMEDRKRKSDVTSSHYSCTVMYSKYDAHRVAAVVGTDRATHMVNSEKGVHMFVTGES